MRKLTNSELPRLSVEEFKNSKKFPILLILDNIRSLNNIGSVFRSADAFLIEHIFLCGITATPPHKDIQKTALGSTESVSWSYHENIKDIMTKLKSEGVQLAAIEQAEASIMLDQWTPEEGKKYAFIFGNEVKGVQQNVVDQCDLVIEIPQFGTKHSLNIANSATLVIWDVFCKMKANLE